MKQFAFLLLLSILLIISTSCSGPAYKSIEEAISYYESSDNFAVFHTAEVTHGEIAFYERFTQQDIAVAFISMNGRTYNIYGIGGYLSQDDEAPEWHYSSREIANKAYSIYFGRLPERPAEKMSIRFNKLGVVKEASLTQASSSFVWFVVFDERTEDLDISVLFGEERVT
ncbi:hypothetical protein [Paenibacillus sp. MSJ-34]|uniref:hypothetical protein n=1 Tax=Paenibacillus sp. MSJ-34 TaxID=2841529 RepID=UPI001C0F4B1C|nr:hypothetical protein [Paenibacillus sp. MSJ-34]MBU5440531.1 hypothetical protein [Paenibacillus sp. MSJ-34]